MASGDRSNWVPVLEKMLADLKALHAYLRGEMSHENYCERVGNHGLRITRAETA